MEQKFNRVALHLLAPAVDAVFQVAAREDGSRPHQQGLQQRKFPVRQLHAGAVACRGLLRGRVQRHHPVAQQRRGAARLAPQHRTHARQQFCHLEGLEHIVIGPAIQTAQPVVQAVACRNDQQRHRVALRAQVAQHLQPVLAGQPQVQQHQVIVLARQAGQGRLPVLHPVHRIRGVLERALHGFANHGVVFDQQYPHWHSRQVVKKVANAARRSMGGRSRPLPEQHNAHHHKGKQRGRGGVAAQGQAAGADGLVQKVAHHGTQRARQDESSPEKRCA